MMVIDLFPIERTTLWTSLMDQKREKAWRAGMRGELIAAVYLMVKGYRVLARRYKTPVGEIDLIVARRNRLAFVEVKARAFESEAVLAVSAKQQQRIKRAAGHYISRQKAQIIGEIGFDVIAISPWKLPRHYKDAFSHTGY